ncbi:formin-2-like [Dendropsophus ebraccatus]|uniref:formin-2-like n=1 Tax=Dendropsophus ebraccatus TaxID=150705 RepID=UPI0038321C1A
MCREELTGEATVQSFPPAHIHTATREEKASSMGQFLPRGSTGLRKCPATTGLNTSRSADWTNELIKAQNKRKGRADEASRTSSSVPASSLTLSNGLQGQTLLDRLFCQQRRGRGAPDAERLCSDVVPISLFLPFSDCFREQCTKSAEHIPSTRHQQSGFGPWTAVTQPAQSMHLLEEAFPQRIQAAAASLGEELVKSSKDFRCQKKAIKATQEITRHNNGGLASTNP